MNIECYAIYSGTFTLRVVNKNYSNLANYSIIFWPLNAVVLICLMAEIFHASFTLVTFNMIKLLIITIWYKEDIEMKLVCFDFALTKSWSFPQIVLCCLQCYIHVSCCVEFITLLFLPCSICSSSCACTCSIVGVSLLSNSKWKGCCLKIQAAKESFLRRYHCIHVLVHVKATTHCTHTVPFQVSIATTVYLQSEQGIN